MRITNLSAGTLYLRDLRLTHSSQVESRSGEDRYLGSGHSVYLPNTSEVLRSAYKGDLRKWSQAGIVSLENNDVLAANGDADDTVVLTHGFGLPPVVHVLKLVGSTWVDGTGTVDIFHDSTFNTTTVTNTLVVPQTLFIRLM